MVSVNPASWIRSYMERRNQPKKEPTMADVAGLVIKDSRLDRRIQANANFDLTNPDDVQKWIPTNIKENVPFLMAGDKADADTVLRAYAMVLHGREFLKNLLMTTETFSRHKGCGQETVKRVMPAVQKMKLLADGSEAVESESGSITYSYCIRCKRVLSPSEVESWEVSDYIKPHYKKYMDSWNRTVAECSIVVYGKTFYPEHMDPRPLVVHNQMPNLGNIGGGGSVFGFPGLGGDGQPPQLPQVEAPAAETPTKKGKR